jgi:uncharacterized protein
MTLQDQLLDDMKASMKAGDAGLTATLRLLRSSIKNEEIRLGRELSAAELLKQLQKEAKQRRDSASQYREADRPELAEREEYELMVIGRYLPQPLSLDELIVIVDGVIGRLGHSAQMGQIIAAVLAETGARADGSTVARIVRERMPLGEKTA